MDNQRDRDTTHVSRGEQIRENLADWLGKPVLMADMDHFVKYMGVDSLQRGSLDNILSESLKMAKRGEMKEHWQPRESVAQPAEAPYSGACTKSANDKQVGGSHYQQAIQHWDYVVANQIPYLEAQIMRYVGRHKKKGGLQDLQKAEHFLKKLMETEYKNM